jgi:hypothetical protein
MIRRYQKYLALQANEKVTPKSCRQCKRRTNDVRNDVGTRPYSHLALNGLHLSLLDPQGFPAVKKNITKTGKTRQSNVRTIANCKA